MSIHWPIIKRCVASPTKVAMIDETRTYRRAELLVGSLHLASAIKPKCNSNTLGVLLPTSGAFAMAALAGWILGKVVVPLNYLLKPDELAYVINDCETDTVISATKMIDFVGAAPKVPNLLRLDEMSFDGVPEPIWPASANDEDLGVLLYTSGTSGRPKGVMLTHGNIAANVRQINQFIDLTEHDVALSVLPQFHSFGLTVLTVLPLTLGFPVVFHPRFVPAKVLKSIREHRPTIMVAIPSMYNALLSVKDGTPEDFNSLRFTVSGGEPLPDATAKRFLERFGVTLAEGYGLTETSPVTNWCRPREWRAHSVGGPLPGVRERVVGPDGLPLEPGQDGEVQMAGPNIMQGYFKLPEETAKAFTPDGFFRSGDIGRFDADGHLYITGRLKEMLIIGGENVFPREIEEVLNAHPSVHETGVIGTTDPMRGELPVAFVQMKDGAPFDERDLRAWCRQRLAGYKVPAEFRHVQDLPRNPTGKLQRRELKAWLVQPPAVADH